MGANTTEVFRPYFIFRNLDIEQGQTVDYAALVVSQTFWTGTPSGEIAAVDEDDIAQPPQTVADVTGATLTTARISGWQPGSGTGVKTVEVTSLIQEVVDRPGWAQFGSIMLVIINGTSGTADNTALFASYDHATSPAPVLRLLPGVAGPPEGEVSLAITATIGATPAASRPAAVNVATTATIGATAATTQPAAVSVPITATITPAGSRTAASAISVPITATISPAVSRTAQAAISVSTTATITVAGQITGPQAFTDDFNRADTGSLGANWLTGTGNSHAIVSNELSSNSTTNRFSIWATQTYTNDNYSEAKFRTGTIHLVARNEGMDIGGTFANAGSAYLLRVTSTAITFYWKADGGTATQIDSPFTVTVNSGDTVRLEVEGTTLRAKINGVEVASVTDTNVTTGKSVGVYTAAVATLDDWAGGDFVATTPPTAVYDATASGTVTATNSTTGSSITPTTGKVIVAVAATRSDGQFPGDAMVLSGLGYTWTQQATAQYASRRRIWLFEGKGTPSAGGITLIYTPNVGETLQELQWLVVHVDDADNTDFTDGAVAGAHSVGTENFFQVTVGAALNTDDRVLAFGAFEDSVAGVTSEAGYTELADVGSTNVRRMAAMLSTGSGDTTPRFTWTNTGQGAGVVAVILKAGVSAGPEGAVNVASTATISVGSEATRPVAVAVSATATITVGVGVTRPAAISVPITATISTSMLRTGLLAINTVALTATISVGAGRTAPSAVSVPVTATIIVAGAGERPAGTSVPVTATITVGGTVTQFAATTVNTVATITVGGSRTAAAGVSIPVTATIAIATQEVINISVPVTATISVGAGGVTRPITVSVPVTATIAVGGAVTQFAGVSVNTVATITVGTVRTAVVATSVPITATITVGTDRTAIATVTSVSTTATITVGSTVEHFIAISVPVTATITPGVAATRPAAVTSVNTIATVTVGGTLTGVAAISVPVVATVSVATQSVIGLTVATTATITVGRVASLIAAVSIPILATITPAIGISQPSQVNAPFTATITVAGTRTGTLDATVSLTATVAVGSVATRPAAVSVPLTATVTVGAVRTAVAAVSVPTTASVSVGRSVTYAVAVNVPLTADISVGAERTQAAGAVVNLTISANIAIGLTQPSAVNVATTVTIIVRMGGLAVYYARHPDTGLLVVVEATYVRHPDTGVWTEPSQVYALDRSLGELVPASG
jgi:hypothetical protein